MIVHTNIVYDVTKLSVEYYYSMVPIKRTVFLPTVTVLNKIEGTPILKLAKVKRL